MTKKYHNLIIIIIEEDMYRGVSEGLFEGEGRVRFTWAFTLHWYLPPPPPPLKKEKEKKKKKIIKTVNTSYSGTD